MARALDYQGLLLGTVRFRQRCHDQIEAHSAVWCRIIRTSKVPLAIPNASKWSDLTPPVSEPLRRLHRALRALDWIVEHSSEHGDWVFTCPLPEYQFWKALSVDI
jgi:hypothetical protein